ncbi:hypothetical protein [Alkalithermobacter paradoxus]|uniref:Uncharacterized protein n=1 Tax=Alkalithermobacter paradoxus TaxID=29349 RepID=A0A1V4I985_9FIRM|nr:hypothetical protein CLOTH_09210 [[Clostridium] thermoalcaliphilum]
MNKMIVINSHNPSISNIYYEDSSLYIRSRDSNNILMDTVEKYDISLDCKNNIHIVCSTYNGELYYLTYVNNIWEKNILKKLGKGSVVKYLKIINLKNIVHIFYYLQNKNYNISQKLIHVYGYSKNWRVNHINVDSLMEDNNVYFIDTNEKEQIFILSKIMKGAQKELALIIYSNEINRWELPFSLELRKGNIRVKNFLIDSKNNIHIVYIKDEETDNTYYSYKNIYEPSDWNTHLIGNINGTALKIFEIKNQVIIISKSNNLYTKRVCKFDKNQLNTIDIQLDTAVDIVCLGREFNNKYIDTYGIIKNDSVYLLGVDDLNDNKNGYIDNSCNEAGSYKESIFRRIMNFIK